VNAAVERLTREFTAALAVAIDEEAVTRASAMAMKALKDMHAPASWPSKKHVKARRKSPVQLCPAPGCTSPAAPVFGMVCAKHRLAGKRKIKAWRKPRRARKGK
jgi:hypothetical protein